MEINNRVILVGNMSTYGCSQFMQKCKDAGIICEIVNIHTDNYNGRTYYILRVPNITGSEVYKKNNLQYIVSNFSVSREDIRLATEEEIADEANRFIRLDKEINKEVEELIKTMSELSLSTLPISKRDFTHKETIFTTNLNYAQTRRYDTAKDVFSDAMSFDYRGSLVVDNKDIFAGACCAFTKTRNDVIVYIPKIYMDAVGYSEGDLVAWLNFLEAAMAGSSYLYRGISDLPQTFDGTINSYDKNAVKHLNFDDYIIQGPLASSTKLPTVFPKKKNYYKVILKGDYVSGMITYMRFIALRYLYNDRYYSIPGTAMQIKEALGDKVSHWEAFMMAHMRLPYYSYYSFFSTNSDPALYLSDSYVEQVFADPFTDYNSVVNKLTATVDEKGKIVTGGSPNMNVCFSTTEKVTRRELNEYFSSKNWKGLWKYLNDRLK